MNQNPPAVCELIVEDTSTARESRRHAKTARHRAKNSHQLVAGVCTAQASNTGSQPVTKPVPAIEEGVHFFLARKHQQFLALGCHEQLQKPSTTQHQAL